MWWDEESQAQNSITWWVEANGVTQGQIKGARQQKEWEYT